MNDDKDCAARGRNYNYVNSFDIDGVINMGDYDGLYPGKRDIIITGRSYEEQTETQHMMHMKNINNPVYYNPLPFDMKTRESSGQHKGHTMVYLREKYGLCVELHFEDDPIQAVEIEKIADWVKVVLVKHDLVEKENVRHI